MIRRPAPVVDLAALNRLTALLRRLKPDLIHAHSSKAGFIARMAGRRVAIPVLFTPHVFAFDMRVSPLLLSAYRKVEQKLMPHTACLIAVSRAEEAAALALGYAPGRVRYIPNGIPLSPDYTPPPLAERRYDLVFIGRFCRQKGIDLMIEALEVLLKRRPDLRVAVMGSGSRTCERHLAELPGWITRQPFDEAEASSICWSRPCAGRAVAGGHAYAIRPLGHGGRRDVGGMTDAVTDGLEALLFAWVCPRSPTASIARRRDPAAASG